MSKIKLFHSKNGKDVYIFFCPACQKTHAINNIAWSFDGNYNRPTISPKILVTKGTLEYRCHSYITDGKIKYDNDCTHSMRNIEMDLPELPLQYR